jgi:hypothetical protein
LKVAKAHAADRKFCENHPESALPPSPAPAAT